MKALFVSLILAFAGSSALAQIMKQTVEPQKANGIIISAVGDIMMGTNYPVDNLPADEGKDLFAASSAYFNTADIRFGNLEGTLFDGQKPSDAKSGGANRWLFRTPTTYIDNLQSAGFNVVSLANNHSHDFGQEGINSTKRVLKAHQIQYSSKDGEVATFNVRGITVAVIAADFYRGQRSITTPESLFNEIQALKKKYAIVIVSAHVGREGKGAERIVRGNEIFLGENRGDSIAFAHGAVDNGADLILMHGPHVPRAMDVYKNKLIVYSLGNFATNKGIAIEDNNGLAPLVRIQLDKKGDFMQGHLASFVQTRKFGTVFDPNLGSLDFIKKLSRLEFPNSLIYFKPNGFFSFSRGLY